MQKRQSDQQPIQQPNHQITPSDLTVNEQNEPYYKYIEDITDKWIPIDCEKIRKLAKRKFSGKIIIDFGEIAINFFEGSVTNMNKRFEFEPSIIVKESVRLGT